MTRIIFNDKGTRKWLRKVYKLLITLIHQIKSFLWFKCTHYKGHKKKYKQTCTYQCGTFPTYQCAKMHSILINQFLENGLINWCLDFQIIDICYSIIEWTGNRKRKTYSNSKPDGVGRRIKTSRRRNAGVISLLIKKKGSPTPSDKPALGIISLRTV